MPGTATVSGDPTYGVMLTTYYSSIRAFQLVGTSNNNLSFRCLHSNLSSNAGTGYGQWNTILHSNNYTNYTVTKTGSGASGTWNININGNAITASALTSIVASDEATSSAVWRRLWMCYVDNTTGRPAYDDRFAIQTSTGTLKAPIFSGNLTGNAATATALTSSAGAQNVPIYFSNGKPVAVTLKNTCNNLLNALDIGSSTPVDADYYIAQYVNGGTTTTTYHRRPVSALYSYIKGKTDSVYLKLTGGTLTGKLIINVDRDAAVTTANSGSLIIGSPTGAHIAIDGNEIMAKASGTTAGTLYLNNEGGKVQVGSGGLYGAVWNDYAEYRSAQSTEPGRVVREDNDGIMKLTIERLMPACEIISDTFGFAIGQTDNCNTPIAATGRVLAYPYEDRYSFELGQAVCSGPNGTVSKMTREEIMMYPERIIGTVSEIPEYQTWGTGNVAVNGRIWIRIR